MIIQNIVSLLYLKNFGQWTGDRKEALVFPNISYARHFYEQHQLSLSLAVFLDAEEETASEWSSN